MELFWRKKKYPSAENFTQPMRTDMPTVLEMLEDPAVHFITSGAEGPAIYINPQVIKSRAEAARRQLRAERLGKAAIQ